MTQSPSLPATILTQIVDILDNGPLQLCPLSTQNSPYPTAKLICGTSMYSSQTSKTPVHLLKYFRKESLVLATGLPSLHISLPCFILFLFFVHLFTLVLFFVEIVTSLAASSLNHYEPMSHPALHIL